MARLSLVVVVVVVVVFVRVIERNERGANVCMTTTTRSMRDASPLDHCLRDLSEWRR